MNTLANVPKMGFIGQKVWRFLRRKEAEETWWYERIPYMAIELFCLVAGVIVTPAGKARWAALALMLPALVHAELTREERSGERKRDETDRRAGIQRSTLACDKRIKSRRWVRDVLAWVWPVTTAIVASIVAGTFVLPIVVGLSSTIVRLVRDRVVYPAWRNWWEVRR